MKNYLNIIEVITTLNIAVKNAETIFSKMVSKLLLMLFSLTFIPFFLANIHLEEELPVRNPQTILSISSDVLIHNKEIISVPEAKTQLGKDQDPEIFIFEGATIYNAESFGNVKITNVIAKKQKKQKLAKKVFKEKQKLVASKRKEVKPKVSLEYFNSGENSSIFSQSENKRIVFSQNRTQLFFKALASSFFISSRHLYRERNQSIIYQNPSITVCYFSGKHSVRPPTCFA